MCQLCFLVDVDNNCSSQCGSKPLQKSLTSQNKWTKAILSFSQNIPPVILRTTYDTRSFDVTTQAWLRRKKVDEGERERAGEGFDC